MPLASLPRLSPRSSRVGLATAVTAGILLSLAACAPAYRVAKEERAEERQAERKGDEAGARFKALLEKEWAWTMEQSPEWASAIGHPGQDHRWTDSSLEAIEARNQYVRELLGRLEALDPSVLGPQDQLNYEIFLDKVRTEVAGQAFPGHLMPLHQLSGPHRDAPYTLTMMRRRNEADYAPVLARLGALPKVFEQTQALLAEGLKQKVTPPKVVLRDVPEQLAGVLTEDPFASPLLKAFAEDQMPKAMDAEARQRLRAKAEKIWREALRPAVERFRNFVVDSYIPGAVEQTGIGALPEGKAWYAWRAQRYTTTSLTPQQIHDLGQSEVKRIRAQMESIREETGFEGDLVAFMKHLQTDPKFFHTSAEALLAGYRDIAKRADAKMPELFAHLPRVPYGVIPVPDYQAKSSPTAFYQGGSLKLGRPGMFYANTYNLPSRPRWEMVPLTLHEAVPGHHHQIGIAQELEGLPAFRKYSGYTAFSEGWGLYAESLGHEMGLYEDPYDRFGALTYEMWRAVRLVVDTGMHVLGWSREQAIDFFVQNSSKPRHDIVVEIDRYLVWPGQALAYKVGELRIKALRKRAEKALGDAFDVRAFHDTVLLAGSIPLAVLERRVDAWIALRRAGDGPK